MKTRIEDLAIFGGTPAFSEKLHVGRPNIGDRERLMARLNDMLDRRYFSNDGPLVREFEAKLAAYLGVKHCVAICNGTVALEILIRALGLKGEVIVPAFTFVATAHALKWQEIEPVFCDIDPSTHCLDPKAIEQAITPRTTGIIGVHLWGRPCDVDALEKIASARKLELIYDAAHAFGASIGERMLGQFGRAEILSFHATKFFNSFEGGAIVTNDDQLAERCRLMRNFGFAGFDKVVYVGTNGKMTEPCAAMGLTSLESVDHFIDVNRRNYTLYREELGSLPGLKMVTYNRDNEHRYNYQYIVFELDAGICDRDLLQQVLCAENIVARRYFYPGVHRMAPYNTAKQRHDLSNTENLSARVISLPTGTQVDAERIKTIADIVRFTIRNGAAVQSRRALSSGA